MKVKILYGFLILTVMGFAFVALSKPQKQDNPISVKENDSTPIVKFEPMMPLKESSATKLECNEIIWEITWSSSRKSVTGSITVSTIGGKRHILSAEKEIFAKLSHIENVSASCRPTTSTGALETSKLIISGISKNRKKTGNLFFVSTTTELKPEIYEN